MKVNSQKKMCGLRVKLILEFKRAMKKVLYIYGAGNVLSKSAIT